MKIRAKAFGKHEVTVIDFVSAYTHDVKAVCVDNNGKVYSYYIEDIEIVDKDYISIED